VSRSRRRGWSPRRRSGSSLSRSPIRCVGSPRARMASRRQGKGWSGLPTSKINDVRVAQGIAALR
jgi:hypothetical protein